MTIPYLSVLLLILVLLGCNENANKQLSLPPQVHISEPLSDSVATVEEPLKTFDLQPVIDRWVSSHKGLAGVAVYDLQNQKSIGAYNADSLFFTASIYKLFVAYEGYLALQHTEPDGGDICHRTHTSEECLDAMIRSSESICAQTILGRLGKREVSEKLKSYGMKNTSLNALTTTAQDVVLFLKRVFENEELSEANRQKLFDSMLNQQLRYRSGLPRGFSNARVYNKVGWNEHKEWHDAAIVTLENGRSYALVVLTRGIGGRRVIELARLINQELLR